MTKNLFMLTSSSWFYQIDVDLGVLICLGMDLVFLKSDQFLLTGISVDCKKRGSGVAAPGDELLGTGVQV
jgi:hypothetical protein